MMTKKFKLTALIMGMATASGFLVSTVGFGHIKQSTVSSNHQQTTNAKLNYSLTFGYGVSNFVLNNISEQAVTVDSLSFDYAGDVQSILPA